MAENDDGADASFGALGLPAAVQRGVLAEGFSTPTRLQRQVLERALGARWGGGDLVVHARHGTGKTAAEALAMLGRVAARPGARAVCLCACDESAAHVAALVARLDAYAAAERGGEPGDGVAAGPPARLLEEARAGGLRGTALLVVDDLAALASSAALLAGALELRAALGPARVQALLFTSRFGDGEQVLAERFAPGAAKVQDASRTLAVDPRRAYLARAAAGAAAYEVAAALDGLELAGGGGTVVFAERDDDLGCVAARLGEAGYVVAALRAGASPRDRREAVAAFETGRCSVLAVDGTLAGAVDFLRAPLVVQVGLPRSPAADADLARRFSLARGGADAVLLVTSTSAADAGRAAAAALALGLPRGQWAPAPLPPFGV